MNVDFVVQQFVKAINERNVEAILALITGNHRFIDSLGSLLQGHANLRQAWLAYFGMVPDYLITVDESFKEGPVVALFGQASGTYSPNGELSPENKWETPAAWRAVIEDGRIAEWRVYADNEPIRKLMRGDE